jgi:hypothetical protein
MASTFSPSLRIELIGDGDQSGIWGQTTNNNLGALIEQAISGVVTITMVDANYTLTNFNGVTDEARNAVLVVEGTNSTTRDIIAPLVEKLYVVRNLTSGGQSIRIIGASGDGVTIANGVTTQVYCDGTGFFVGGGTSATTATTAGAIANAGGWNVTPTGTKLFFNYNGTNVASLDSSGNLIVLANITAFGTP